MSVYRSFILCMFNNCVDNFNSSQYFISQVISYFFRIKKRKMRDIHSSRNIHSVTKLRITWNILLEFTILCNIVYTCITQFPATSKRISSERFLSQRPFSCGTGVVSGKRWIPRSIADLLIAPRRSRFGAFSRFLAFMRS